MIHIVSIVGTAFAIVSGGMECAEAALRLMQLIFITCFAVAVLLSLYVVGRDVMLPLMLGRNSRND